MKGNLKATLYQSAQVNAKPEGFSLGFNTVEHMYDLDMEERNQNTVSQYNEMLKNTIDFSEFLNPFSAKQEEDMFFADHWPRKEIGLMRTKSKQKLVDLFKSDEGFEYAGSFGNEGSVLLEASDHHYSHPICFEETRSLENGLSNEDLTNAILGNQFSQLRLSSHTSNLASGVADGVQESNLHKKTEDETQVANQLSDKYSKSKDSYSNIQAKRNQSLENSTNDQNKNTFCAEEESGFEHALQNESEVSGVQSFSTRNSIESSVDNTESLKKWTEISINLYASSSHKSESETEEVSLRLSRKKKKTEKSLTEKMSLEEQGNLEEEFDEHNYPRRRTFGFGKRSENSLENTECSALDEDSENIQSNNSFDESHEASWSQSPSHQESLESNLAINDQSPSANLGFVPPQSSSSSLPRLSPEAVTAILNQFEPKELLGSLPISPEILEEIERSNIISKIKNANQKRIGPLSVEERKLKVEKFFEKKKQRSWNKRINYQCRKEVADSRLRIKGRFVTRNQARVLLGPEYNIDTLTNDQIRDILHKKFEEGSGYKIQNIDMVLKNHQKNRFGSKNY